MAFDVLNTQSVCGARVDRDGHELGCVSLASFAGVWCVSLAPLASFSGVWCVSLASFSGVWCVSLASFPSVWCVSLAPLARGHARDAEDAQKCRVRRISAVCLVPLRLFNDE